MVASTFGPSARGRRILSRWAAVMALLLGTSTSWAQLVPPSSTAASGAHLISLRDQEIASCQPGEVQTWKDGRDRPAAARTLRFAYRHEGAPSWFTAAQVLGLVQKSAQAWTACGLTLRVMAIARDESPPDDAIQIVWSETGSRGQFGLANLAARSLSLSPGLFGVLRQRNPRHPAEETLQMALSHEMGHFLGLMAHSRRCVDVMSYYDDGRGQRCALRDPASWGTVTEYRSMLPTACDLERCRAVNR
ncbi:hypothetical protein [Roseateles amylovorans]|uniref:Peptidase metallopeptidase domain-containing protein n=1 Tax=Roseateles amylovorans TaxID=2978473 RepID=A0ABY6B1E5_9BURK|nr:hypothetical protein [Roseateles amylovorans]UXH78865.1 hypothetical protein N4261_02680 [Roseateles amylovorans]